MLKRGIYIVVLLSLWQIGVMAQPRLERTARFFEQIRPLFTYNDITAFNQDSLQSIAKSQFEGFNEVDSITGIRLFRDSKYFTPGMQGVYYYSYHETYGKHFQIVLCVGGDYAPVLILMTYAPHGDLMSEIHVAGNFVDGGEAYAWNSTLSSPATLNFNYNSYYQKDNNSFFCDSTISTYAIRSHGSIRLLSEHTYTVATRAIGGGQLDTLSEKIQYSRVFAPSGLKLRESLNRYAEVLTIVPYGADVEVLEVSPNPFAMDWVRGNWVLVKYDTLEGYLFDGYLSTYPAPPIGTGKECYSNYALQLRNFTRDYFTAISIPDTVQLNPENGEAYHLEIVQYYEDSLKLTIQQFWEGSSVSLEFPEAHLEEVYILLAAILEGCDDAKELKDSLLFVKDRYNVIYKIYDRDGNISIQSTEKGVELVMNFQCCQ